MTSFRDVIDMGNCPLVLADQLVGGAHEFGVAHFILAATHPGVGPNGGKGHVVTARLIIPAPRVFLLARSMLATVGTKDWMLQSERDDCELTH